MKRGFGFSGKRGLEPYKYPAASRSGALNAKMLSSASIATSDISSGSVRNLKLAADIQRKSAREQATSKELEMANAKLKKLVDRVHILEEKLQSAFKVKQKEDEKLWKRLQSKFVHDEGTRKQLEEEAVAGEKMSFEGQTSNMEYLHLGIRVKEEELSEIRNSKEMLEKESMDLSSCKPCLSNRLDLALEEIKRLEDLIKILLVRLSELDRQSLSFPEKVVEINASFDSCLKLAQHEKDLDVQCAQQKIDQMHYRCSSVTIKRNSLQLHNDELHTKVIELQKEQEFVMVQHACECRLAEKVGILKSEAETLLSKQNEMQVITTQEDLLMKLFETETTKSKGLTDRLKADIPEKQEQLDVLQTEIEKSEYILGSHEKLSGMFTSLPVSFMVSNDEVNSDHQFIIDTGTTDHVICSPLLFTSDISYVKACVHLADQTKIDVRIMGDVKINDKITLHRVLYVPAFHVNLLSVSKVTDEGKFDFVFTKDSCYLQEIGSSIKFVLARRYKSVYVLTLPLETSFSTSI